MFQIVDFDQSRFLLTPEYCLFLCRVCILYFLFSMTCPNLVYLERICVQMCRYICRYVSYGDHCPFLNKCWWKKNLGHQHCPRYSIAVSPFRNNVFNIFRSSALPSGRLEERRQSKHCDLIITRLSNGTNTSHATHVCSILIQHQSNCTSHTCSTHDSSNTIGR